MRPLPTALRRTGWLLLAAAASAGVIASAGVLLALTPAGRPVVAGWAVRAIDRAIAGSVELDGLAVLAAGGVEARGLRITSPGGTEALRVERARIFLDVTRLRSRELGLAVELEGPAVDLSREPDGALALARAFSPAHPAPGERPR